MKRRILVPPTAAAVISALCLWRSSQPGGSETPAAVVSWAPAPSFELYDQNSRLVRFSQRFSSRQQTLVVFFGGSDDSQAERDLRLLGRLSEPLRQGRIAVVCISPALPQEHRRLTERLGGLPFVLLSDIDLSVHRLWNRLDPREGRPVPGVFLVDRAGNVAYDAHGPVPADGLIALLSELGIHE